MCRIKKKKVASLAKSAGGHSRENGSEGVIVSSKKEGVLVRKEKGPRGTQNSSGHTKMKEGERFFG